MSRRTVALTAAAWGHLVENTPYSAWYEGTQVS